jgi:hypothetical protein
VNPRLLAALPAGIIAGEAASAPPEPGLPTGFSALDASLPGGGWPLGALTEVLPAAPGVGEIGLLLPALSRLSREGRWLAWIDPPHIPYAPALAAAGVDLSRLVTVRPECPEDALWAAEQALGSGAPGAVLMWPPAAPGAMSDKALRRLQLAAERGRAWGILFRPPRAEAVPSPAALRLAVLPAAETGIEVRVFKCRRGGTVPFSRILPLRRA